MTNKESQEILRNIPSIDKILQWQELQKYQDHIQHEHLVTILRISVDEFRQKIIAEKNLLLDDLKKSIIDNLEELSRPYFTYAINGIGIVLHTGLGRAPFCAGIADTMHSVSVAYSRLQIDAEGKRADRYRKISRLLNILTGAEAGIIVNNNAAATMLILNAVAKGKEAIVSRGQLIEIGGSFRIPDVMAQSGAIMREVGTTNRTHLKDYEGAINEKTGAIIRVHQSNYTITGFTKEVPLEDLVNLGKKYNIPIIDDLGSGALIDFSKYGLPKEPLVQDSVKAGADVICFSGDKLIGGPQCGIIIGKKPIIEIIKKNPLARALRCDKLTNAALEATLTLFLKDEASLIKQHTVIGILLKPLAEIKKDASKFARSLDKNFSDKLNVEVKKDVSEIGGGSLSTEQLPTYVAAIHSKQIPIGEFARKLRVYDPPIFGRVTEDSLLFDFRTILKGEEKIIIQAISLILQDS